MKVKGIISENKVSLPELKNILRSVEGIRVAEGREMSYEFRKSLEHANRLSKTTPEKARALVVALSEMDKIKQEIAYRIANIMPKTRDEIRAIFAKERFTLTLEEIDAIRDMVKVHF